MCHYTSCKTENDKPYFITLVAKHKSADPTGTRRVRILLYSFSSQFQTATRFYLDSATPTTTQRRYSQTPRFSDSLHSLILGASVEADNSCHPTKTLPKPIEALTFTNPITSAPGSTITTATLCACYNEYTQKHKTHQQELS